MSEKRFTFDYEVEFEIFDRVTKKHYDGRVCCQEKICDLLNKQQDTIITLKRRLEKINGGYGHLTHRNGLTANEWVIESQEKELKKKNEQISDWIEQHSKNIVKICEQQAIIKQLEAENEQLKKARDESDEFIAKKGLEVEFLNWCVEDE